MCVLFVCIVKNCLYFYRCCILFLSNGIGMVSVIVAVYKMCDLLIWCVNFYMCDG